MRRKLAAIALAVGLLLTMQGTVVAETPEVTTDTADSTVSGPVGELTTDQLPGGVFFDEQCEETDPLQYQCPT